MASINTPITDPTDITTSWSNVGSGIFESSEVYINADTKVFYFKEAGNFSTAGDGVTGQALYSFFKDRWKNEADLPQYEFPMLSITNEQFEFINGWKMDDTTDLNTRKMIRTAGWSEVETDGTVSRKYYGFVSLGTLGATDQIYYAQDSGFEATLANTEYTDAVNEAIQFYGNIDATAGGDTAADDFIGSALITGITSASIVVSTKIVSSTAHGLEAGDVVKLASATDSDIDGFYTIDSVTANTFTIRDTLPSGASDQSDLTVDQVGFDRSDYFKAFVRTRKKTYADADLADIGVTSTTYIVYRFPITNADDLNINTTDDAAITGSTISSIAGDGTTITVDTSSVHGLYEGAPITVSGATGYNGNYVVASVTDNDTITITDTTSAGTVSTGTLKLRYVDAMDVTYLDNPDTLSGDVDIKGNWTTATTYTLGDVVFDVGNSSSNADGARWYYLNATSGDSTGANLAADTVNNTWTLWTDGQRDIEQDDTWSAYSCVYDLNNGGATPGATKEVAYEYAQYLLRQTTDINAGTNTNRKGKIADTLVFFVGSTLHTYSDTTIPFAVVLDDISDSDVNNVQYNDFVNASHLAPTVVSVTINFNNNLYLDTDSIFKVYYTTGTDTGSGTRDFGTPRALVVKRTSGGNTFDVGSDVSDNVPNDGEYAFNYAYTADATNGRATGSSAADVNITIVSIGLETGQYVTTTGDITSTGATFSMVAPLERNYSNPA